MSGTSMDGVDVSVISSDGYDQFTIILNEYFQYDNRLQQQLINLREIVSTKEDLTNNSEELKDLERNLTFFHADKVDQISLKLKIPIDLIGFHGQTIFHNPQKKVSKQLGDGKLLSQLVKKKVVYEFRQADIQNNGQGAPLTPIFHYLLSKKINEKKKYRTSIRFFKYRWNSKRYKSS